MSDNVPTPDTQPVRFERLHTAERWWLRVGSLMLIVFLVVVGVDSVYNASMQSHGSQQLATENVASTAPFDKPGTYEAKDGTYDAIVVAYAFGFLPLEDLVVPVDTKVRFHVASLDVVHGFTIPGTTNVNLEVLPGHVSEVTQTFSEPGRYLILCNEYCGSGHHFMTAHIRVLKRGEDPKNPPKLDGTPVANAQEATEAMEKMSNMAGMDHGDSK